MMIPVLDNETSAYFQIQLSNSVFDELGDKR